MNSSIQIRGVVEIQAYRIIILRISQTLKEFKLNATEWSVLGITYESVNGSRLIELAKMLSVVTALITITVDALVRKELILRLDHPNDKRSKLLFLTQKGKKLVPIVENAIAKNLSSLLAGITEEDRQIYQKVLGMIVANYI